MAAKSRTALIVSNTFAAMSKSASVVIKSADWVIDLGPEGGAVGGKIVAEGTPEEIAANLLSHTGKWLARVLYIFIQVGMRLRCASRPIGAGRVPGPGFLIRRSASAVKTN